MKHHKDIYIESNFSPETKSVSDFFIVYCCLLRIVYCSIAVLFIVVDVLLLGVCSVSIKDVNWTFRTKWNIITSGICTFSIQLWVCT